jgi:hypothetical protein
MLEITVIHKADPELVAQLDRLIAAVGLIRVTPTIPAGLFEPVKPPAEKLPARRGRPREAEIPTPPPAPAPSEAGQLPDYDTLKTELRDMMTRGMAIDAQNKDKVNRTKIQEVFRSLHPDCDGKMSGLPDELLEKAAALVREILP